MQPRIVLTIAGSDSGGGAGIQADLRTFAAHGVHGTTAITAITAQNTLPVTAVCALEAEMVVEQIDVVVRDLAVVAVKTGMLARPATVRAVAREAALGQLPFLVVDPVLVSSTGHDLMEEGGAEAYRRDLLPHAFIATPNLREAALLTGIPLSDIYTVNDMVSLGRAVLDFGSQHVLLKGGHFAEGSPTEGGAPDIVVWSNGVEIIEAERVVTKNDHGTGCSMAAAITANLALGYEPLEAIRRAKSFVHDALQRSASWKLGTGHGPIDHLGWNQ